MKKILFVCVENAGRSQMAEGFFRKYLPEGFEPISAGTKPSNKVNPIVIQVMKEVGIDISEQTPKSISNDMIKNSKVVNMGCIDKASCPALFLENVEDWNIPDPKEKPIEQVREIRDQIEKKVIEFVSNL
ncbi:MAG TPA: arsenate reductase ArsC [Nitrosarchaeum sp.]|jgi:protein-tyrosine-phosphatase|nr:arsenate reductase ArsC [Nitrosarchaeum sp.]